MMGVGKKEGRKTLTRRKKTLTPARTLNAAGELETERRKSLRGLVKGNQGCSQFSTALSAMGWNTQAFGGLDRRPGRAKKKASLKISRVNILR